MTKEKHREYMRQWGRKNRDKVRAYNRKSYLRRKEAKPKTKNRWGDGRRRIDPSEKAEMFEKTAKLCKNVYTVSQFQQMSPEKISRIFNSMRLTLTF